MSKLERTPVWLAALTSAFLFACGGSDSSGDVDGGADAEVLADAFVEPNAFVESYAPITPPAVRMNRGVAVVFTPSSQADDYIEEDTVSGEVDGETVRLVPYYSEASGNREYRYVPFPLWTPGSDVTVRVHEGVAYGGSGESMVGDFAFGFRVEDAPFHETFEDGVTTALSESELEVAAAGGDTFAEENVVKDWQSPDSTLYLVSEPVDPSDPDVLALASKLIDSLDPLVAAGLAAPQIGVNRRMFAAQFGTRPADAYINPVIVDWAKDDWYYLQNGAGREGCVSIDDVRCKVARHRWIKASFYTSDGSYEEAVYFENYDAVLFQHEYDHLNGILMTDRREEQ